MSITLQQKKLIEKYEFALANIVFDGKKELAERWSPIVEALQNGHFVWAIVLASQANIPAEFVELMRLDFDIRRLE